MKTGDHEIPRRPLLWLAVALVFTVPPVFRTLAFWVPLAFVASLAVKFWMERRGVRMRSMVFKVMGVAAVTGGVWLTYHSLFGLESGLSLFLLLTSVKIMEAHTSRDFHIMALLGWFLCLTGLFVSQDLSAGIYATIAFTLILAAVVQFHHGPNSRRPVFPVLRTSAGLVLRSLPLVIALFFLFPRGSPFRFDLRHSFGARTGMSNSLKPGDIASLAQSTEVAFRVEFPDGNMPAFANLYWRGGTLTRDHGLAWNTSVADDYGYTSERLGTGPIRQRIILQPHGGFWVFALEWPVEAPHGTKMVRGNVLRSDKPIYNQWHYEVNSYSNNRETELDPGIMNDCLQLPPGISPQVHALVDSWTKRSRDPRAIIGSALAYFHKENFRYTLSPGPYGQRGGLDDFLFQRRAGFCEHYAAAFATLMRVAGIPSRVAIGYQGGQFNTLGKYLVVHQSDAHAWCEVWVQGLGWQRVDPTAAVAPERVSMGTSAADAGGAEAGGQFAGTWERQPLIRNIRLAWEAISYEWDSRVANFDDETQQSFFLGLGWLDTGPMRLFAWLAVIGAGLLGVQALWTWWRTRVEKDPLKVFYERFCGRVAALGVKREPWEGPQRFAERAAELLPAHAQRIRRVAGLYITLRYSPGAGGEAAAEFAREIKAFRRAVRA